MKKTFLIIVLLSLVSCVYEPFVQSVFPTATSTFELETEKTPQISPTVRGYTQKEYDVSEWKLISSDDMAWQIEVDSTQQMWIRFVVKDIVALDKKSWELISEKEFSFSSKPITMEIASDDSLWVLNRQSIAHFKDDQWSAYTIPNEDNILYSQMAIDPLGVIWLASSDCFCKDSILSFDGLNWSKHLIPNKDMKVTQMLFTSDGALWAVFYPDGLGKFDGKEWKIYTGEDFSWTANYYYGTRRIATDKKGSIYGLYDGARWTIIKIDSTGHFSEIPFGTFTPDFNPILLRIFIDAQDRIWVNACIQNRTDSCLAYYAENQWVSFTNLPFTTVTDIAELHDGTLLIGTEKGVYTFTGRQ